MKPKKQTRPTLTRKQRWTFRIIALLLPLLLLAAMEILLRAAGYGYLTDFFLKQRVNGRDMLIENWQFGWRFFPREIARTPQPVMFPARKEPGTIRIFVLGESAAMGDPEPAFGLPRLLQAMLELRFPSNRFEVINVAMTAINSHVIREIAKDCAPLEGDAWIVYMGNNEVVGPFGSGTVFTRQAPGLDFIRVTLWLKQFRLVQWIGSLRERRSVAWEGMEMFLRQRVPSDDPRMQGVYEDFKINLGDIVRIGQESGARVIVGTVAVNLRDCPPFAPVHSEPLNEATMARWETVYARAGQLIEERRYAEALEALHEARSVAGTNNLHAGWFYQLACSELGLGSNDAARIHFGLARQLDTLRFRADDHINTILREIPAPEQRLDTESRIANASRHSIPGSEFFYEHVHLTFEGNYLLALSFFEDLLRTLPASVTRGGVPGTPTLEQCAGRLAWTDWDRMQVYEEVRRRLQQPPFTAQLGHAARDKEWQRRIEELGASLTPMKFQEIRREYEEALRRADDWVLRENLARLLEATGDAAAAIEQWRTVARLLPHDVQAQFHLGNLLDASGRSDEALAHFRAALLRNPASPETRNGLALALANLGRVAEADREFAILFRHRPGFSEGRVNYGQMLAKQGRVNEAMAQYRLALQFDTNSVAAHVNLGRLLNQGGDKGAAIEHYHAALRINPRHPVAHFNLGNTLRGTNAAEAARHYAAAVQSKPDFAEAHLALAMELSQSGQAIEAEKSFKEAIRLQPESISAHFNYGVLLANQKRFTEAAGQFRRTLELEPAHPMARQFLARVQGRP